MRRRRTLRVPLVGGLLALLAFTGTARADCTDPPAPGVNWQRCNFDGLDLTQTNLSGARLRDGSFFRSDFTGSDLSNTEANRAKFVNTTMVEVTLDGAQLYEADLTKADLTGASMVGVDLRRARLYRAILRGADLTGARTDGADVTRVDFSGATWTNGNHVCAEGSIGRCN
ncbi:MAG: pentapeptide repeat-containing protein [Kiloniellales bacterium]